MKSLSLTFISISAALLLSTSSCNSQSNTISNKKVSNQKATSTNSSAKFVQGTDYTVFVRARILDKTGFSNPVEAFSVLIPNNWKFEGDILWTMPGNTCAGTNRRFKAGSSDGKYIFEIFPDYVWSFTTDQQLAKFNQNYSTPYCGYGEPLNAEHYVKQVFLPAAGNPRIQQIKTNEGGKQSIQRKAEKYRQEIMKYGASQIAFYPSAVSAKVKWTDGSEGIILCGVLISEITIANPYNKTYSKSYTSSTSEKIIFRYPASESENASKLLSVIMSSVRTNDTWKTTIDNYWVQVRQQKQTVHLNKIKMMDDYTRAIGENIIRKGQQNLNNMDANMRNWEEKQKSDDRIHTNFIKTIREVENYRDETGKIELSSGYDHAWSKGDGSSFIMTNNPNFNPSSAFQDQRWKEMKKAE